MNVYHESQEIDDRCIEWRISHFKKLIHNNSEISLLIFCSPDYLKYLQPVLELKKTMIHIEVLDLKETRTWKSIDAINVDATLKLPSVRNELKDTAEYIALMNAKSELIHKAIDLNLWNSDHYAWIDFNIYHIFKTNPEYADKFLQTLVKRDLQSQNFIAIPGCWPFKHMHIDQLVHSICWRFCGGFFIGTKESLLEMDRLYECEFAGFLRATGVLTWEVNFWAFLEYEKGWTPVWYAADHNESMLEITPDVCCRTMNESVPMQKVVYDYPRMDGYSPDGFTPSTTSHICIASDKTNPNSTASDIHVLNTRFVNYHICENGAYSIDDPNGDLETRNMFVVLDNVHQIPKPGDWIDMEDDYTLKTYGDSICGLEDIRMFHNHNNSSKIRFVASNKNYQPDQKIRIMMGEYDISNREYRNMRRLDPPADTYCEKNWIPLPDVWSTGGHQEYPVGKEQEYPVGKEQEYPVGKEQEYPVGKEQEYPVGKEQDPNPKSAASDKSNPNPKFPVGKEQDQFIYRWSPFEIGELDENNKLKIIQTIEHKTPYFHGVRGSSCFVFSNRDNAWIAVVHFSEERWPRHYYHMLVLLDYDNQTRTFSPVRYTNFFCFNKKSIEFCTGFTIDESDESDEYIFWISNFDRDPECIKVRRDHIPFHHIF
jgi:hypothetical protein